MTVRAYDPRTVAINVVSLPAGRAPAADAGRVLGPSRRPAVFRVRRRGTNSDESTNAASPGRGGHVVPRAATFHSGTGWGGLFSNPWSSCLMVGATSPTSRLFPPVEWSCCPARMARSMAPDLVVEITSSQPARDRVHKFRTYYGNQVPWYWIIDPDVGPRRIPRDRRRLPPAPASIGRGEEFKPALFPGLMINLAALVDEPISPAGTLITPAARLRAVYSRMRPSQGGGIFVITARARGKTITVRSASVDLDWFGVWQNYAVFADPFPLLTPFPSPF